MATNIDWDDATHDGQWWTPQTPGAIVGGVLNRAVDGLDSLRLFGWLGEWDESKPPDVNYRHAPTVIHGEVHGRPVSLLGCYLESSTGGGKPRMVTLGVTTILVGLHVANEAQLAFDNVSAKLDYLNEWADRTTLPVAALNTSGESLEHSLAYEDFDVLRARLPNASATLYRTWTTHWNFYRGGSIETDEVIEFQFPQPIHIDDIVHDYVRPVRNYLSVAARRPCGVVELSVGIPGSNSDRGLILQPSSRSQERAVPRGDLLFRKDQLGFGQSLSAWFIVHESLDIVCDLLVSLWEPGNVANKFLNAASALEGYHIRTFPQPSNKVYYAQRLRDLVNRTSSLFGSRLGNDTKWIDWVKEARNSIAHRDPNLVDIEKEWRAATVITRSMRWLLVVLIMQDMSLPPNEIQARLQRQWSWNVLENSLRNEVPSLF